MLLAGRNVDCRLKFRHQADSENTPAEPKIFDQRRIGIRLSRWTQCRMISAPQSVSFRLPARLGPCAIRMKSVQGQQAAKPDHGKLSHPRQRHSLLVDRQKHSR
jgi:hypothetical protein